MNKKRSRKERNLARHVNDKRRIKREMKQRQEARENSQEQENNGNRE